MTSLPTRLGLLLALCALQCAPVMPQRSKPGGAARWAFGLAQRPAILWAQDAQLCHLSGVGVGTEGWLPDRGGSWILTFWSPSKPDVLEISIDSDGATTTRSVDDSPHRGHTVPSDWKDSSTVWVATRSHRVAQPLNTFQSALAHDGFIRYRTGKVVRPGFVQRTGLITIGQYIAGINPRCYSMTVFMVNDISI